MGGGTSFDYGYGVAVQGSSLYVTGVLANTASNAQGAVFGGSGLVAGAAPQFGASATLSNDLLLAKYTDNGATGSYVWSRVGGGPGTDNGNAVAISGQRLLAAGSSTLSAPLPSAARQASSAPRWLPSPMRRCSFLPAPGLWPVPAASRSILTPLPVRPGSLMPLRARPYRCSTPWAG